MTLIAPKRLFSAWVDKQWTKNVSISWISHPHSGFILDESIAGSQGFIYASIPGAHFHYSIAPPHVAPVPWRMAKYFPSAHSKPTSRCWHSELVIWAGDAGDMAQI